MFSRLSESFENIWPKDGKSERIDLYKLDLEQPIADQLCKSSQHYRSPWPTFTSKQIEKARTRFARKMTDSEQVILFHDCSVLQRGSIGLIVTAKAIYTSYLPVHRIPMSQIKDYYTKIPSYPILTVGAMPQLYVNNECAMYSCHDYELFDGIMMLLKQRDPISPKDHCLQK